MRTPLEWWEDATLNNLKSLRQIGVHMWLQFCRQDDQYPEADFLQAVVSVRPWMENMRQVSRVSRKRRALFPLPAHISKGSIEELGSLSYSDIMANHELITKIATDCWCDLSILFCNKLHDGQAKFGKDAPTKPQQAVLRAIKEGVVRVLSEDEEMDWDLEDVRADISKKLTSYTGEEIGTPEEITLEQMIPALPPASHGGSIPVVDWLEGRTRWLVTHPDERILEDHGQELPKLQKKVHIKQDESLQVGKALVERGICDWVKSTDVFCYRGQKILNGLFGVQKGVMTSSNKPVLRLVMNLIPTNAILKEIRGRVSALPNICSWCNIVLDENELLSICQNDMTAAFYLYALPPEWKEKLCFNLSVTGRDLGRTGQEGDCVFYLACRVLPMGWSSAVGIMQAVAEEVLLRGGMPSTSQVRRGSPLPSWVTKSMERGARENRIWWHVYLDNYASGERRFKDEKAEGGEWQCKVEGWWQEAGILSSKKKQLKDSLRASELGAYFSGNFEWMGASPLRLFKLCKSTVWVLRQPKITRKMLQVLMGRWVFVLQFRRPAMAHFEAVWEFIGKKGGSYRKGGKVREELLSAIFSLCLVHTFLGARVDDEVTCSDASATGGAVARACEFSELWKSFLQSQLPENRPTKVPIVLVSLFNGIGGAYRCMDVAGAEIVGGVAVDIHRPSNRTTQRRWPHLEQWEDIRTFTSEVLTGFLMDLGILPILIYGLAFLVLILAR